MPLIIHMYFKRMNEWKEEEVPSACAYSSLSALRSGQYMKSAARKTNLSKHARVQNFVQVQLNNFEQRLNLLSKDELWSMSMH